MKKYEKQVRWNFKYSLHGYGKTVKEALIDALEREMESCEGSYVKNDYLAIQNHEVDSIEEDDIVEY